MVYVYKPFQNNYFVGTLSYIRKNFINSPSADMTQDTLDLLAKLMLVSIHPPLLFHHTCPGVVLMQISVYSTHKNLAVCNTEAMCTAYAEADLTHVHIRQMITEGIRV